MGGGCDLSPTPRRQKEVSKVKQQAWTLDPVQPVPVPHSAAANLSWASLTDIPLRGVLLISEMTNCRERTLKVARIARTLTQSPITKLWLSYDCHLEYKYGHRRADF